MVAEFALQPIRTVTDSKRRTFGVVCPQFVLHTCSYYFIGNCVGRENFRVPAVELTVAIPGLVNERKSVKTNEAR